MQDSVHKMVGKALIRDSEAITESENRVKRCGSYYQRNKGKIQKLADAFGDKINCIGAEVATDCVDVKVSGDTHMLNATFGVFRKLGYEPSERPGREPKDTFSCYWDHPDHDCRFWLYFTSTVCKRVKVGTKMVETPVYETLCE